MKNMHKSSLFLVIILLATPFVSGQSLSAYRKFSLGTSLTALAKQIGQDPHQAALIHQTPAVIQQLKYWLNENPQYTGSPEAVSQILFKFYNSKLYRIEVTYDQDATEGMTDDDMVQAISSRYGIATKLNPESELPANDDEAISKMAIARWQDSGTSVTLVRSVGLNTFALIVTSKPLDGEATAAIAESLKLEQLQAPQKEIARQKEEADKLEVARLKNIKAFRY